MRFWSKWLVHTFLMMICELTFLAGRMRISREHTTRAMANPLRAAGLSKAWTDLLRLWFTEGWFLVEGDAQPCLQDIGIKPGDTCAAAGFNLFFQQFQVVLRNRLRQLDLVTEIPVRTGGNFSDPPRR